MSFVCIWCQKSFPDSRRTKEHLKPICIGGGNEITNLEDACYECNQARGIVTSNYGDMKKIERYLSNWGALGKKRRRQVNLIINRFRERLKNVQFIQEQWIALEKIRFGKSYLHEIVLIVPRWRKV